MSYQKGAVVPAATLSQKRGRLADEVAHVLWELIMRGELAPGTQLLQIQLAEQLGVSRTPLREAFRILERDGLVRISNGNKTVEVIELDESRLVETYQIREVIDGLAARLAAGHGLSPDLEARLDRAIKEMARADDDDLDISSYGDAHTDFHLTIMEASGNSQLQDFSPLVRLSTHMVLTRYLLQNPTTDIEQTIHHAICEGNEDHQQILEAIKSRDSKRAETLAKRHIRKTTAFIQKHATHTKSGAPAEDNGRESA